MPVIAKAATRSGEKNRAGASSPIVASRPVAIIGSAPGPGRGESTGAVDRPESKLARFAKIPRRLPWETRKFARMIAHPGVGRSYPGVEPVKDSSIDLSIRRDRHRAMRFFSPRVDHRLTVPPFLKIIKMGLWDRRSPLPRRRPFRCWPRRWPRRWPLSVWGVRSARRGRRRTLF